MKLPICHLRNSAVLCFLILGILALAFNARPQAATSTAAVTTNSPTALPDDADKAWKEVQKASRQLMPPAEWQGRPTEEQVKEFRGKQLQWAEEGAEKAMQFYTKFPNHAKAEEAHKQEFDMLRIASRLGGTNTTPRLIALENDRLKDPKLSEDERFQLRMGAIEREANSKESEGQAAILGVYEKGARELIKEFPKRDDGYQILLQIAGQSNPAKARELAKEIKGSSAPDQAKAEAQDLLEKLESIGKPVLIKFAAIDGREVDLAKLKGKVVLVDFWATWCGPCVAEIPNVKKAYEALHPKGFEIVGISFDQDKSKLEEFVKKEGISWPQYFDGQGWGNKFGQQFGIHGIPAMWLLDKKGNLRDMNARGELEEKVKELLKEDGAS